MATHTLRSQIHECYKTIDRIIWVVDDLEHVKSGWQKLGFDTFIDHGITKVSEELQNGEKVNHSIFFTHSSFLQSLPPELLPEILSKYSLRFRQDGHD